MQFSLKICDINILYNVPSFLKFLHKIYFSHKIHWKCADIGFPGLKIVVEFFYLKVWTYPVLLGLNFCFQICNSCACMSKLNKSNNVFIKPTHYNASYHSDKINSFAVKDLFQGVSYRVLMTSMVLPSLCGSQWMAWWVI